MAKGSARKIHERNLIHLSNLRTYTLAINTFHILIRLITWSFTFYNGLGFAAINAVFLGIYVSLNRMATPTFVGDGIGAGMGGGKVEDAGVDLGGGGLVDYYFDVVYIGWFVTIATLVSDYFWYTYAVIPIFAAYKLYNSLLKPFLSLGGGLGGGAAGADMGDAGKGGKQKKEKVKIKR
ncbi:hypothetical protein HK102_007054, partial [Quaeritorhiza haematococci]